MSTRGNIRNSNLEHLGRQIERDRRHGWQLPLFTFVLCLAALAAFPAVGQPQGTLTCAETAFGSISVGVTQTWTFTASAGDSIVVRLGVQNATAPRSLDPYMRLYGPDGTLVDFDGGYGYKTGEVFKRATSSGTFSVEVNGNNTTNGGIGSYRITLGKTGGPISVSAGDEGGTMVNGGMHIGVIDLGDLDVWSFNANAGDGILVRWGNATTNGTLDLVIRLYGPEGAALDYTGGYGYQAEEVVARATTNGTFTVMLSGGVRPAGGSGPYRVTLAKTGSPITTASGDEGGPMTNGFMHTGFIDLGDADVWSFNANPGDGILVRVGNLSTNVTLDPWIRLYGPDGVQVDLTGGYGYKAEDVFWRATTNGPFTVVVTGGSHAADGTGPYRLTLAKTGSPITTASGDEGGSMINGFMHTGFIDLGDLDVWSISAVTGETIIVRMGDLSRDGPLLDPALRLYAPDGRLIQTVVNYGYIAEEIVTRATTNGIYLVTLNGANRGPGVTGPYRLNVAKTGSPVSLAAGDEGGRLPEGFSPHSGRIELGDLDVWTFLYCGATNLTIDITEVSDQNIFAPWLRVYGPDGALLASRSGLQGAAISVNPTKGGLLTLVVSDDSGGYAGTGTYSVRQFQGHGPIAVEAVICKDLGTTNLYGYRTRVVPTYTSAHEVGFITAVVGDVTITNATRGVRSAAYGGAVYFEDTFLTGPESLATIEFCDFWSEVIPPNGQTRVSDVTFNPLGYENHSLLTRIFRATSDWMSPSVPGVERTRLVEYCEPHAGCCGIRGDASDYIDPRLLDVAVTLNVGSPVTLVQTVPVPTNPFQFSFDYSFLRSSGNLSVTLGGMPLFAAAADSGETPAVVKKAAITVTNPAVLGLGSAELALTFDGPVRGHELFLDNIQFPGATNGNFSRYLSGWSSRGPGRVDLVGTLRPPCSGFAALNASVQANQATLTWPLSVTNYVLETTTNLQPPASWASLTNAVTTATNRHSVTVPVAQGARFYRLRLNCN